MKNPFCIKTNKEKIANEILEINKQCIKFCSEIENELNLTDDLEVFPFHTEKYEIDKIDYLIILDDFVNKNHFKMSAFEGPLYELYTKIINHNNKVNQLRDNIIDEMIKEYYKNHNKDIDI